MKAAGLALALVTVMVAGAACGSERSAPPRGIDGAAPSRPAAPPDPIAPALAVDEAGMGAALRPDTAAPAPADRTSRGSKPGLISIEGFDEWFQLDRFQTPAGFPLPFSTYAPADLLAQGGGDTVVFVADFAAHRNDAVALRLVALPAGTDETGARAAAAREAAQRGQVGPAEPRRYDWSLVECPYRHADRDPGEGLVALGRHGDRYFLLVLDYPDEYAEGFLPRADRVLRELRWSDTGTGLRDRRR